MKLLEYNNFYLVGIKGVAMTAMVQLLTDAGKTVRGCDVAEEFVTQPILDKLNIQIDTGFEHDLPADTDCVIFTAAHNGEFNPMVQNAQSQEIPTYSHAAAQAEFFNTKQGIAVCGVGGKSTVSAMLAWIFEKTNQPISYSVGVGNIPGLEKTARWDESAEYCIAEADEYVTDPSAPKRDVSITPRFSFLHPHITICTNLKFDHPDVYTDFEHTKAVFNSFFNQIDPDGVLVHNVADTVHNIQTSANTVVTFGASDTADIQYSFDPHAQQPGKTIATITYKNKSHTLTLQVPGEYNVQNATAAIAGAFAAGVPVSESVTALARFASTQRRFEKRDSHSGVTYYDDYAHHPNEIKMAIAALNTWYPDHKKVIAFQPHTYSRTKQLLHEFTHAFKQAETVYLLDIFASARESADPSISSDILCEKISAQYPELKIENVQTISALAQKFEQLPKDTIVLTLGAGDIYKVHDKYMQELYQQLTTQFPNLEFKQDYPLARHTTVKIGGPADIYCETKTSEDFIALVTYMRKNELPLTLLGWGANTLISDAGIRGLVVKNVSQGIKILDTAGHETESFSESEQETIAARWQADGESGTHKYDFADLDYDESDAQRVLVELDSGVSLPFAINILIQQGITGLQWYARIPATVGGAIYNNIHGGTHFISEVIKSVTIIDEAGNKKVLDKLQLKAGYDVSRFHETEETIVSATFKLYKGDAEKAAYVAREWAVRKKIQPQRSLGCVFQNISNEDKDKLGYPTTSVGYIVEHILGKKGYQIGGAQVSDKHAAFIENAGEATAHDYLQVIKMIIKETKETTGVTLKPEIFFLGFTEDELAGVTH